jgi:hypothetical protein
MGLNVCVDIDAAVFQKDAEAPEVRFYRRKGDFIEDVKIEGRVIELKELATLGVAVTLNNMIRIQGNPLMS